jgi:PAS domain S-box-containing protein
MKLRTQFIITMLLFAIILVVIGASAIITNQLSEKAGQQGKIADNIVQGASELSFQSSEYLIYRESQQLKRWQSGFASFSKEVAGLRADRPEHKALVANIKANQNRLKDIFDSVVSALESPSRNQSADLAPGLLQVSWSRMAVQSQALISDASRLSQLMYQQRDQLRKTRAIFLYGMVGLFGVFLLASYVLTYRHILGSIVALRDGAAAIGSGDLDFVIEEKGNDEIGDLSRTFNRMTTDLKAVTASKADLEREIVGRKKAEESLRKSEQRWATTLASIGDAVIATDIDAKITFMNVVAEELTGWTLSEAMAKPVTTVFDIVNEQTRQKVENPVTKVLKQGNIVGLANHTVLVRKDRTDVPIDDSGAPIRDPNGTTTGVVLVFRDITERKRAEEALVAANERASWLARFPEENPSPVMRVAAEGGVLYCNPASKDMAGWGCKVGESLPRPFLKVFGKALGSGREAQEEIELGKRIYSVWVAPVTKECYANVYGRDVTERKQAEEALLKAHDELEMRVQERTEELGRSHQRLQQLSSQLLQAQERERKRIAAELHDSLLSELAAMKYLFEAKLMLLRKGQLEDTNEFNKVMDIMQRVMKDARGIMNNLRPSILDEVGLIPTIGWFTQEYQKTYGQIQIRNQVEAIEKDIPDLLKVVIFRVLQEALNNFAKHGRGNLVELSLIKSGDALHLRIQDNGQGFDMGNVKKGLGLESMRERVDLSGGEFQIESSIGRGTTIQATWSIS